MKLRSWYIMVANTAILFLALQVAAYAVLRTYYYLVAGDQEELSDAVKRNYSHMTAVEQQDLRDTFRRLQFRFEPQLGILYEAITSRYVNINDHGIRANRPGPRPMTDLDGATWFLGGSTTFGEDIADHEAIPAQLERMIGRPVINLGVPGFSSPVENLFLVQFLRDGYRPSLVLFMDGINELCTPDLYVDEMRELFRRAQQTYYWDAGGPLVTLVTRAARRARRIVGRAPDFLPEDVACSRNGKAYPLADLHARIMAERAALCGLYQIECHTLVQPFAGTHGPTSELPGWFIEDHAERLRFKYYHLEPGWRAAGATFIVDALDHYQGHPFVDEVHYSADASRVIAEVIVSRLRLK